jgi:Fe-S-cluster-containing dehydrogenase component
MKKHALRIDEAFCWGCKACEVACKQENHVPDGVKLIALKEEFSKGSDGAPNVIFRLSICRHCDDPPCVAACPVEAITQRQDGIVVLDHGGCTGCESCLEVCPYDAIAFDRQDGVASARESGGWALNKKKERSRPREKIIRRQNTHIPGTCLVCRIL